MRNERVIKIDIKGKSILTDSNEEEEIKFDKLFLSTGSIPNFLNKNQKFLQPNLKEYQELKLNENIFIIRDIQQVTNLNEKILSFKEKSVIHH